MAEADFLKIKSLCATLRLFTISAMDCSLLLTGVGMLAGFDEKLVGPKGQGYRWHAHGADMDALQYSIAPPLPSGPDLADDYSDEESQAATNDEAPDLQQLDPDVRPRSFLSRILHSSLPAAMERQMKA